MKQYNYELESVQPYLMTKALTETRKEREDWDDYEQRVWKDKGHYNDKGQAVIKAVMFKRALESAASYLGLKITGKGNSTYAKVFRAAVQIIDDIETSTTKDTVVKVPIYCHSDGKRGSGKRVWRNFPMVPKWTGTLAIYVADDMVTEDILSRHVKAAGQFIGVGGFRAESGNQGGRFRITTHKDGKLKLTINDF